MKKYNLISLAFVSLAILTTGCEATSSQEETTDTTNVQASVEDSLAKAELEKEKLAMQAKAQAEADRLEAIKQAKENARQDSIRLEAIRQDSIKLENQKRVLPMNFFGSDLERKLSELGFEADPNANTNDAQLCVTRFLFGRKMTVVGNNDSGTKLYEIIFSDQDEKNRFVQEIQALGLETNGTVYFEDNNKASQYFRGDADRIIYGPPDNPAP